MLTLITVSIGGLVEIVPLYTIETTIERVEGMRPYSPLELAGRNIYIREGCYICHSQMIRPFRDEVERYGHYSLAAESMYDHPFQWGSKRTGPDLARVGGKYSDDWHVAHMIDPRAVVPESVMPPYALPGGSRAGLPRHRAAPARPTARSACPTTSDDRAGLGRPARPGRSRRRSFGAARALPEGRGRRLDGNPGRLTEMDALVAYLQILGRMVDFTDIRAEDLLQ